MLDGVYLSSLIPEILRRIEGQRCTGTILLSSLTPALEFEEGYLILCATPGTPYIRWVKEADAERKLPPVWSEHLKGSSVVGISQQGSDRVLEIVLRPSGPYSTSGIRLIFEATGRNSNLILVRADDSRILAALRAVSGGMCRYRTVSPGGVYRPPPSSGIPAQNWKEDREIREVLSGAVSKKDVYRLLEGVGPVTAEALLREAEAAGTTVHHQVILLAQALTEGAFHHWMGPEGPLPIKLGPGHAIPNPLSNDQMTVQLQDVPDGISELRALLAKERDRLWRKVRRQEEAILELVPEQRYRLWGEMLLSQDSKSEKGRESIELTDWEGHLHEIPLRSSRSLLENAQRYFRKARNAGKEAEHLKYLLASTLGRMEKIEELLTRSGSVSPERIRELLRAERSRRIPDRERAPLEIPVARGWRCFAGRNAADNDRVTFGIGKRGDYWFHARGTTGAHVVLKVDGRKDKPPAGVLKEAAAIAATRCGSSPSGVVPVDYTLVQYVRKTRGGRPGQVIYTREKTLFIDLDKQRPSTLDSTDWKDQTKEGDSSES
jgi:predicted ribosome quality control (RQC) complex YloA/Tae2 family protein